MGVIVGCASKTQPCVKFTIFQVVQKHRLGEIRHKNHFRPVHTTREYFYHSIPETVETGQCLTKLQAAQQRFVFSDTTCSYVVTFLLAVDEDGT